jgi:nitroimidazol reductase NimA-like FMN-containing flavoprotein (pyridoxamine 5'-phosphate oxidase superfamily)
MTRIDVGAEGDVLTRDECLHRLASGSVGRVSTSSRALPSVLPVRYRVAGDRILFWADPHDHPAAIADNTVIGFQADDIDAVTHEGWSVMVVGLATHVTGDESVAASEDGPPRGWAAASGPLVALSLDLVNGRRLSNVELPGVGP